MIVVDKLTEFNEEEISSIRKMLDHDTDGQSLAEKHLLVYMCEAQSVYEKNLPVFNATKFMARVERLNIPKHLMQLTNEEMRAADKTRQEVNRFRHSFIITKDKQLSFEFGKFNVKTIVPELKEKPKEV